MTLNFSLVIPCYNEARSLPELVARSHFTARQGGGEVILVDNGSTDDTQEVLAREIPDDGLVRSVTVPVNQGYGYGILAGLATAGAPVIGWTHADLQTDPADVLRAMTVFEQLGTPLFVKGRRYGRPIGDRVFTAGMSAFESVLLGKRLSDINAQPTMFHRGLYETWGEPPTDFALDLFAIHAARSQRVTVARFPVIFAPRKHGTSSWNIDLAAKRKFIKRTIDYSLALRRKL